MRAFSSMRRKGALSSAVNGMSGNGAQGKRTAEVGSTQFVRQDAVDVAFEGTASPCKRIRISLAEYQAKEPFSDRSIMEASTSGSQQHIFAAVFTSEATAYGGDFMKRNMYRELLVQVKAQGGNIPAAFRETISALDRKYRALHIYNTYVLDGTHMAAAFVDISRNVLYLASNGGCRAVVSRRSGEQTEVFVDIGRDAVTVTSAGQQYSSGGKLSAGVATVPLSHDVESIVLGSMGLWRELPAHTAVLRLSHYHESTPLATGANAAAHLTQYALQTVVERTVRSKDRRMAALKSTETLQQLWKGDRSNYRWSARQPMRRRAGDVHGDLTAIVIHLDWEGTKRVPRNSSFSKKLRCAMSGHAVPRNSSGNSLARTSSTSSLDGDSSPRSVIPLPRSTFPASPAASAAARHWDLVRMHFLRFCPEARAQTRQQWYNTIYQAAAAAVKTNATAAAPLPVASTAADVPRSSAQASSPVLPAPVTAKTSQEAVPRLSIQANSAARAALAGRSYRRLPTVAVH